MIKHHPKDDLLTAFVCGELPASIAAAVAIHADMCISCKQIIAEKTNQLANHSFDVTDDVSAMPLEKYDEAELADIDFDSMLADITRDESIVEMDVSSEKIIKIKNKEYLLPKPLHNMPLGNWLNLGKLTRARVNLGEGEIHTSLLQIAPQGKIPDHTHNGYELTLLLEGEFHDEMGTYQAGDFILLDGQHLHSPVTETGCLCYTVVSDALHFTKGINKLLNPIGSFIY